MKFFSTLAQYLLVRFAQDRIQAVPDVHDYDHVRGRVDGCAGSGGHAGGRRPVAAASFASGTHTGEAYYAS